MKKFLVPAFVLAVFLATTGEVNAFFFHRRAVNNVVVNNVVAAPVVQSVAVVPAFSVATFSSGLGFGVTEFAPNNSVFLGSGFGGGFGTRVGVGGFGGRFGVGVGARFGARVGVGLRGGVRVGVGTRFRGR